VHEAFTRVGAMLTHAAGCVLRTNPPSAWMGMRGVRNPRMLTLPGEITR
jgi:hypothetical protein